MDVEDTTFVEYGQDLVQEAFILQTKGIYYVHEILDNVRIPFIYRDNQKYTEKLMLEKTLIAKYYHIFGDEVFECIKPSAVKVQDSEINLLNEINIDYSKCEYLDRPYSTNEVLINMNEVKEMAKFLDSCYNMLVIMRDDIEECGYIRIDDGDTLIPFVNFRNQKLIPLFYFEGSPLNLGDAVIKLSSTWPLAYLKILCKMQNVKQDLFNYCTSLDVISYENLLKMIPVGSNVETCWPDSFECNLLRKIPSQKSKGVANLHKWFQLEVNLISNEGDANESNVKTKLIAVEESDSDVDDENSINGDRE